MQRYTREQVREGNETEGIIVPGVPFFSCDRITGFVEQELLRDNSTINLSLFLAKFPRWFTTVDDTGKITKISTEKDFHLISVKRRLDKTVNVPNGLRRKIACRQVSDTAFLSCTGRMSLGERDILLSLCNKEGFVKAVMGLYKESNDANPKKWEKRIRQNYKEEHLDHLVQLSAKRIPDYDMILKRYYSVCPVGLPPFSLKTAQSLFIGNGDPSVLETSITLHRLYGMPVIPGSSLKGITRAYCKDHLEWQAEKLVNVFGQEPASNEKNKGKVVFLDAWPGTTGEALLTKEMINPHNKLYRREGRVPSDNKDQPPAHVLLLAVKHDVPFSFGILPARVPGVDPAGLTDVIKEVAEALKRTLIEYGSGGKTGSGFGYFKE